MKASARKQLVELCQQHEAAKPVNGACGHIVNTSRYCKL